MRLGRRRLVIQRLKNTYKGLKQQVGRPWPSASSRLKNTYKGLKLLDEGRDGENYRRLKNTYKGLKLLPRCPFNDRACMIEEYL
jgi:hypothetical protein